MERIGWGWVYEPLIAFRSSLSRSEPTNLILADRACNLLALAGDARRTCELARRTLEALINSPPALATQLKNSMKNSQHRIKKIDQVRATEALSDLYSSLNDRGPKPFLVFGTLLGAIRQQGFIPGDSDLDLGVFGGDRLKQIRGEIHRSMTTASKLKSESGRPSKLIFSHPNGCNIDLKSFEPEADGTLSWHTRSGNIVLTKRFPYQFELKPLEFCGVEVLVPDTAEAFLEWQYGPNWRLPDPTYHMCSSGPIHGVDHLGFTKATGPRAILKLLRHGRVVKGLGMARNMSELFTEDDIWPRLVTAIEDAQDFISDQNR